MGRLLVPLLFTLSACGLSADQFVDEYTSSYCELAASCPDATITFDSQSDCEAFISAFASTATESCDYDQDQAQQCLDELDGASCDELENADSACNTVFTGGECS